MTDTEKAAFLITQAACAIVEAIAMQLALNHYDDQKACLALIDKYGIGYNGVLAFLQGDQPK